MRGEGHMGYTEVFLLTFTVLSAKAVLPFPALVVRLGLSAAWLLLLLVGVLAAALCLPMAALLERHPGLGVAHLAPELAGPALGAVLNLGLLAWLLAELALVQRLFTETFITAILPNTPPSVVALVLMAVVVYAAHHGLEPASRANVILVPLILAAFVAILALSLRDGRRDWLFPLWGPGPLPLAATAAASLGFSAEIILLAVHGYALRPAGLFRRACIPALLLAFAALAAAVAVYVGVFGVEGAQQQPFPFYSLARLLYLGRFFQRSEAIFVLFWALTAMVYLCVVLHAAAVTAAATLAVPYYRPLLFPLALLAFAFGLLPRNFHEAMQWHLQVQVAAGLVAYGLPALLLLLSLGRPAAAHAGRRGVGDGGG